MIKTHDYRVWTGTRMDYDVLVGGHGVFHIEVSEHHDKLEEYKDGVPVMQFTGLYDMDGKKIYSGDILHFSTFAWGALDIQRIGCVLMKNGSYDVWAGADFEWFDETNDSIILCMVCDDSNVIGNIHEHPEKLPKFQRIR